MKRSGRELEAFAIKQAGSLGWVLSCSLIDSSDELRELTFQAVEAVRSAAPTRKRLFKSLVIPESLREHHRDLEERLAQETLATREQMFEEHSHAESESHDAKTFFAHVQERDRLERELADLYLTRWPRRPAAKIERCLPRDRDLFLASIFSRW